MSETATGSRAHPSPNLLNALQLWRRSAASLPTAESLSGNAVHESGYGNGYSSGAV